MDKALMASVQYEVRLAGRETLFQVNQDLVRRFDMVAVKRSEWYPAHIQVGFGNTMDGGNGQTDSSKVKVWIKLYHNGGYKKPTKSLRAKWWEEITAIIDAPKGGTVWWHTTDPDRDIIFESIDDSFNSLDAMLQEGQ